MNLNPLKSREVLARRLRYLMDTTPGLNTQTSVSKRAGTGQSTVQRVLTREQGATVDLLDDLAQTFGIQPYELLLVDQDDAALLQLWHNIGQDARVRVMNYLEIHGFQLSNTGDFNASQLNINLSHKVPAGQREALEKASSRKTSSQLETLINDRRQPSRPRKKGY